MPIINDIPQGNVTSPLGAHLMYASKFDSVNNKPTETLLQDYDVVFTEEEDILYAADVRYEPEPTSKEPLISTDVQGAISELNEKILNKEIPMEAELSLVSTNGLQNKVITSNLNLKAPLDSPTFTGIVTVSADPINNLEVATKRYVDTSIANAIIRAIEASY